MAKPEEPLRALEVIEVTEDVAASGYARIAGAWSVDTPDDDPDAEPLLDRVDVSWRTEDGNHQMWELSAREAARLSEVLDMAASEVRPRG